MFPFHFINSIPHEVIMRIQLGAANAIYLSIVFAATALALLITYDSIVDRAYNRPTGAQEQEDQPIEQAA